MRCGKTTLESSFATPLSFFDISEKATLLSQ